MRGRQRTSSPRSSASPRSEKSTSRTAYFLVQSIIYNVAFKIVFIQSAQHHNHSTIVWHVTIKLLISLKLRMHNQDRFIRGWRKSYISFDLKRYDQQCFTNFPKNTTTKKHYFLVPTGFLTGICPVVHLKCTISVNLIRDAFL